MKAKFMPLAVKCPKCNKQMEINVLPDENNLKCKYPNCELFDFEFEIPFIEFDLTKKSQPVKT